MDFRILMSAVMALCISTVLLAANTPPMVDAGPDQSATPGAKVRFNGKAFDPEGPVKVRWQQLSGPRMQIINANNRQAGFVVPTHLTQTTMRFQLTARDREGLESSDTLAVQIHSDDAPPPPPEPEWSVNAGADQTVHPGQWVTLTASVSLPGEVQFQWEQIEGTPVSLDTPDTIEVHFNAPLLEVNELSRALSFQVSATQPGGTSAKDIIIITVFPDRSDTACDHSVSPGDTFSDAFSSMTPGQTLCLKDGVYHQAMDIPSNMHVRAVHDGFAEIDGDSTLGTPWTGGLLQLHGENSSVRGLKVHHAGANADACSVKGSHNTLTAMSCSHGGTHKHKVPLKVGGTGHLIEDSWFYGEGRYVVQCFVGDHIKFRRNVARWDKTAPNFPTEPNAAFSIYNCSDITIENNISLDYGIPESPMRFGGDFYSPQNASVYPQGNQNNQWLGNIAINHSIETDNRRAMRFDASTDTYGNVVQDFYVWHNGYGIIANLKVKNLALSGCTFLDVEHPGSINGSAEFDCGNGADIAHRYIDAVKTSEALFPWPNEALIKRDMCAEGERQSDWCLSDASLTEYVLQP